MHLVTAVELGADTCVFARTSARRGGDVHLSAAEILDPGAFPGRDAFVVAVRQTRRALRLPRRCRVVLWGLPDGANRNDAAVKPILEPLTAAGFRIERVVTPCNALAALARRRTTRGEGSQCWLAINRGGVAIVVVRPGKLLYAHSFAWDSTLGASGSQARLLQRYSLVSFLSPEVKRAMAEARKSGTPVDAVVTCGNLPDLRSLTMPLIEDLDVEVETLDSLEGLVVKPPLAEALAESAPAIRLACAAAIARGTRPWDGTKQHSRSRARAYLHAAAFTAAVVGVGYVRYLMTRPSIPPPRPVAVRVTAKTNDPKLPPVSVPAKKPESNPKTNPPVVTPPPPLPKAPAASVPAPVVKTSAPAVTPSKPPVVTPPPPLTKAPAAGVPPKKPESKPPAVSVPSKKPESKPAALNVPAVSTDKPEAGAARTPPPGVSAAPRAPMPPLLKDAVPRVTAILVSRDRRFATVEGGQLIGIGDLLGRRTVVAVDERSVVFQEPSGVQIRIGLGGRLLGVERAAR
jgi:hypothetical protein